jgi:hypothetical protein
MTGITRDLRTRRFWRAFGLHVLACGGALAGGLQAADILWADSISSSDFPWAPACLVVAVLYGGARSWPRPIRQYYSVGNTEIRIVEGDLFDQAADLVIGVSTTFDTQVPHIISPESVQGQFLSRVYAHDVMALNADFDRALAGAKVIGTIKKDGKQGRYALGTVATLRRTDRRQYYCLAYTEMNATNEARGTVDGLWRSLDSLWREVRAKSNGEPVAVPVLGGGQARMAQVLPAQDAIRFVALSFVLASRSERICERLDIVVRKQDVRRLDMLEIRSFLRSLRPS